MATSAGSVHEIRRIEVKTCHRIPGHYDYIVYIDGTVVNLQTGNTIKPNTSHKGGYLRVQLKSDIGHRKYHLVHRLVAQAFIPNPDELPLVCHRDDNPSNNTIGNLFWG